jgi:hypothetical protein
MSALVAATPEFHRPKSELPITSLDLGNAIAGPKRPIPLHILFAIRRMVAPSHPAVLGDLQHVGGAQGKHPASPILIINVVHPEVIDVHLESIDGQNHDSMMAGGTFIRSIFDIRNFGQCLQGADPRLCHAFASPNIIIAIVDRYIDLDLMAAKSHRISWAGWIYEPFMRLAKHKK